MEHLSLDAKFELFKNMSGKELVKLCNTSKSMRDTCSKHNFYTIWSEKIKQDFNTDYHETDSYLEYLRLAYVYGKTIWKCVPFLSIDEFGDPCSGIATQEYLIYADTGDEALDKLYQRYVTNPRRFELPEFNNYNGTDIDWEQYDTKEKWIQMIKDLIRQGQSYLELILPDYVL